MLKLVECIFKIICACLTLASCFATYKMKSYCLKCRKYIENIDPEISSSSNDRAIILSECAICGSKKLRFIKNQEAEVLLSNLGIKTPLSEVLILGDILF